MLNNAADPSTSNRINRFTIVGGGSAGWMAAGLLAAILNRRGDGPDIQITLIESPNIPVVGVGEATTLSTFSAFNQMFIDEFDFLKQCDASFKQGSNKYIRGSLAPSSSGARERLES